MRNFFAYITIVVAFISCTNNNRYDDCLPYKVALSVSMPTTTKTTIDSKDYKTVHWSKTDKIYLWAMEDGQSNYAMESKEFVMSHYTPSYTKAYFTSDVNGQTAANYTYYAAYPKPKSASGNTATFTLSDTQNGEYDGVSDIMLATPATGAALSNNPDENVKLSFKHLTHLIRFQVPTDERYPMEHKITKLILTFPQDVVGDLAFDITNPNTDATFTNAKKVVEVNLKKPLETGDYFWVFIKPGTYNGNVEIQAYSDVNKDGNSYIAQTLNTKLTNRVMSAGRITPITLTIDEAPRTRLRLNIETNNLGEGLTKVTFTVPTGCKFREGNTSYTHNFISQSDIIILEYYSNQNSDFQSQGLTVTYESEHALLSNNKISLSHVIPNKANNVDMNVPYLFEENFSSIKTFDHKSAHSGSSVGSGQTIDLNRQGLAGWTADRAGGEAGKSLRTAARLEGGMWAQAIYRGRIDSPTMSCIKSGQTVKVKVSYNYSGGRHEGAGWKKGTPKYKHGYTTASGAQSSATNNITFVGEEMEQGTDGSYSKVHKSASYQIDECKNNIRLSWYANVSRSKGVAQNGNYWLYIDKVKVQIVPE